MPLPYRETLRDGKPRFGVLVGFNRQDGTPLWADVALSTARELVNNITALQEFVAKHSRVKK